MFGVGLLCCYCGDSWVGCGWYGVVFGCGYLVIGCCVLIVLVLAIGVVLLWFCFGVASCFVGLGVLGFAALIVCSVCCLIGFDGLERWLLLFRWWLV